MSNTAGILSETGITYRAPVFTPSRRAFWWSPCHLFTFLSCVDFFCLCSSSVLCVHHCRYIWIVHSWLPLWFSL